MARNRMIKPEFWDDQKVAKLSDLAKLLYIGSWNFADDYGVIKGHPLWIKNNVFPYDLRPIEDFEHAIKELVRLGRFVSFQADGEDYFFIPKFADHQVINRPSVTRNPPPPKPPGSSNPTPPPRPPMAGKPTPSRPTHGEEHTDSVNTHGVLIEGSDPKHKHKHKEKYKRSISIKEEKRGENAANDMPFENAFHALKFVLQRYAVGEDNKKSSGLKAKKIADSVEDEFILEKIEHLNWILKYDPSLAKNPAAYLVASIEKRYPPPAGFEAAQEAEKRRRIDDDKPKAQAIGDLITKSLAGAM